MNIAYFLDRPNAVGGAGTLLLKHASLMKEEHHVIVVVPINKNSGPNTEYVERCQMLGLEYCCMYYPIATDFFYVDLFESIRCVRKITEFIEDKHIEFINYIQINTAVEIAARQKNVKTMMSSYHIDKSSFRIAHRELCSNYHLSDSEYMSGVWGKGLDITSRCIRPLSPLEHNVTQIVTRKDNYTFLLLGRVCEWKNQLNAIKAFKRVRKKSNIRLIVAGDLPDQYADECRKYVTENELAEVIDFTGFISNVEEVMAKSDCLLCSSIYESFPSAIVEAISYDLTIVTTPAGGICELLKDGVNAFVADGFGAENISEAILKCIHSYENGSVEKVHEKTRALCENNFSHDVVKKQLEDYYEYIIEQESEKKVADRLVRESYELFGRMVALSNKCTRYKTRVLYYHALFLAFKRKKGYIWGAGFCGQLAYEVLTNLVDGFEIVAFVDRQKEGEVCGKEIIKPVEIDFSDSDCYIFLAFDGDKRQEISFLEHKGKELFVDVWYMY